MDVVLCETGNGGDFIFENNDFKLTSGMSNFIYLGWFGGNIGGDERDREDVPQAEQRFDWFGNDLFFEQDLDFKFNSELETLLNQTALNSASRLLIEQTAEHDLEFLADFGGVEIEASIMDLDKIEILAKIIEPDNQEDKIFTFIWDSTRNEADCLCAGYVVKPPVPPQATEYEPSEYEDTEYETF